MRNRPVLVHGLPETDNPAAWLLALMQCETAPMRMRLSAAKALMLVGDNYLGQRPG